MSIGAGSGLFPAALAACSTQHTQKVMAAQKQTNSDKAASCTELQRQQIQRIRILLISVY